MFKKWLKISLILTTLFLFVQSISFAKEPLIDYLNRLAPPGSNAIIAPSASVTIVTFEDYQCEACAQTHKILKQVKSLYPGRLNFVYRHFPLVSVHAHAMQAARYVEAAAKKGKFEDMHNKLLENQYDWVNAGDPDGKFEEYLKNMTTGAWSDITNDMLNQRFDEAINRDIKDGEALGVKGTPTTFVNGRNVGYVTDVDVLKKEIEKDILSGFFEFYTKGKVQDKAPDNDQFEVIIASNDVDVRTKLPLKVKYESEGVQKEQTITSDPKKVCRDETGCSIPAPTDLPGNPSQWKMTVYDPSGQEIAIYNGGMGSQSTIWHWRHLEEIRREEEEENPFNPKNPQYAFVVLFFLLIFLAAWWGWFRKKDD